MDVKQVGQRLKSWSAEAGAALVMLLLAVVMALTVAAEAPAPKRPQGTCVGTVSAGS